MRKSKKDLNYTLFPGDVFLIPLLESVDSVCVASTQSYLFFFGRLFFNKGEVSLKSVDSEVSKLDTPRIIVGDSIVKGSWVKIGSISHNFPIVRFRIGNKITYGETKIGNFLDVSSKLIYDPYSFEYPALSIYPDEIVMKMLRKQVLLNEIQP